MQTAIIADITGVTADEFDALDTEVGAVACYQRLRQREADRRWHVRYLRATRDGRLVAAVPGLRLPRQVLAGCRVRRQRLGRADRARGRLRP
jgi:hypothetical protein